MEVDQQATLEMLDRVPKIIRLVFKMGEDGGEKREEKRRENGKGGGGGVASASSRKIIWNV